MPWLICYLAKDTTLISNRAPMSHERLASHIDPRPWKEALENEKAVVGTLSVGEKLGVAVHSSISHCVLSAHHDRL